MKLTIDIPFLCPEESLRPHLEKLFLGEYEIPLFFMNPTILDIGANIGAFALWAQHRFPGAKIHCYEPHPESFKLLETNTAYIKPNLHNYAVGLNVGMKVLYAGKNNSGEASLKEGCRGVDLLRGVHVEVRHPEVLPEADILKMDTEGCEVEILTELLNRGRKFKAVLFEYHNEDDRANLDGMLKADYFLVGAEVHNVGRGTLRYVHKEVWGNL